MPWSSKINKLNIFSAKHKEEIQDIEVIIKQMKVFFNNRENACDKADNLTLKKRRMENKCKALNNSYSSFSKNNNKAFSLRSNYMKSAGIFNAKNTSFKSKYKRRHCIAMSEDKENISIMDKDNIGSSTLNVTELKKLVQNVRSENKIIEEDILKLHKIKNEEKITSNSVLL